MQCAGHTRQFIFFTRILVRVQLCIFVFLLHTLGYSQAVRQGTLTPSCVGSNPATPVKVLESPSNSSKKLNIVVLACALNKIYFMLSRKT